MTPEQLLRNKQLDALRRSANRMDRANAGGFATAIAQAYYCADSDNANKLETAFTDLFQRFMSAEELELFK